MSLRNHLGKATFWKVENRKMLLCRPYIMGILNVTPDSFSDGGEHFDAAAAIEFGRQLVAQGADIIDIGGESTRPGAADVTEEQELARVIDVVRALASEGICVSIDTRHASVAKACVEAGAQIINDITGFSNEEMIEVAASCDAGLIAMHMQGTPQSMQANPSYGDVVAEIGEYLAQRAAALEAEGVEPSRICIDPGPRFGKNVRHNLELMACFDELSELGYPLMAAYSRKTTLGKITGVSEASKRIESSVAAALLTYMGGACIFRVHDVAQTVEALAVAANMAFARSFREGGNPMLLPGKLALVSLGSNIGNSVETIVEATRAIGASKGIEVIASSSIYKTEPAYYLEQGTFANSVAWVQTSLGHYELLERLFEIEQEFHRVRTIANGPRTLDLDLIDYEGVVSDDPRLTLPHPRVMERAFTVEPLLELSAIMARSFGRYAAIGEIREGVCEENPFGLRLADGQLIVRDRIEHGAIVGKLLDASEVI
ncbi:MAG: dihydropteroate synthase [Coriobacteriales bacterium]|nr:dihydropteroate synthase [Coriobacteriales bacterium]